jgi:FdhE protein
MASASRIVPQGEVARGSPDPPAIRLPNPETLFAERAARLRSLASRSHPSAEFLLLVAAIADAQNAALAAHPPVAAPPAERRELARAHGLPVLGTDGERDPAWRDALIAIAKRVEPGSPAAVRPVLRRLSADTAEGLEAAATDLLALNYPNLDAAAAPFLAAALQVHWVKRAAALGTAVFARLEVPNVCPVCGSPALASVLRIDVPAPGSRYLHCALCDAEWLLPRGQCSHCETREKVAYLHQEGASEAVKAEVCDECRTYLKIYNAEKDPLVDPVADDLATLALDVALDQAGYERGGPNLFFIPGQT